MTPEKTHDDLPLQRLISQLEDTARQAGDRISDLLSEARVRSRLSDAADAIDDVRKAVLRHLHPAPPVDELEQMTVKELRELAREREIPGRSNMKKAELIDALSD